MFSHAHTHKGKYDVMGVLLNEMARILSRCVRVYIDISNHAIYTLYISQFYLPIIPQYS